MSRTAPLLVLLCGLLVANVSDGAAIATLSVGGGTPVAIPLTQDGNTFYAEDEVFSGAGYSIEIDLILNGSPSIYGSNPYINYGIAATNSSGSPLDFAIVLSLDISATTTPGQAASSISGSWTDGGDGAIAITPLAAPQGSDPDSNNGTEIGVYHLSTNGGGTLQNVGIDVGAPFSIGSGAPASGGYPAENSGIVAGPAGSGSYDFMRVDLNWSQSGGGDIFTYNGSAAVIPEPATAALFGLGLVGLGFAGRPRS